MRYVMLAQAADLFATLFLVLLVAANTAPRRPAPSSPSAPVATPMIWSTRRPGLPRRDDGLGGLARVEVRGETIRITWQGRSLSVAETKRLLRSGDIPGLLLDGGLPRGIRSLISTAAGSAATVAITSTSDEGDSPR